MSKKLYSIPLVGLALSSFGCPQEPPPVVDELADSSFTVTSFLGYATPYSLAAVDVNGDGTAICDIDFINTDVALDANLAGDTTYSTLFSNCVDAQGAPADPALIPPDAIQVYTIAATAVEVNARYDITLTDDAGVPTQLSCTFDGATGVVDCGLDLQMTKQ